MVTDMNYWSKVIKRIFSLALTILLLFIIFKLSVFYIPFLISFVLALLFEPLIKIIMKKLKWTRRTSSIIVIFFSIVILLGVISWGVVTLFNEATNLLSNSGEYIEIIQNFINNFLNNNVILEKLPIDLSQSIANAQTQLVTGITTWIANLLIGIRDWILKIPNLIMSIFFVLISLYFMCTDKIYMIDQLEHHLPDVWTKKISKHLHSITKKLGRYLRAEATLVLISFLISLIGLTIYNIIC